MPDALPPEPDGPVSTGLLSHPAPTGMNRHELAAMTDQLAATQAAQRERQRHTRRGTERRRAPGAGPRPKPTDADRILATVLYLRKLCTQAVLGELFAVDRGTITTAVQETRPLLEQHRYAIAPSTARFPAPADLIAFLARTTEPPTEMVAAARTQTQRKNASAPEHMARGLRLMIVRRRPTLPQGPPCSTIGAERLSFRVRNVTGRFPNAMTTETL